MGIGCCYSVKKRTKELPCIKCIYEIKNSNDIKIINYSEDHEIESKIKILSEVGKEEKLVSKKKFNNIGKQTIRFVVKESINDMSFIFFECSDLKEIYFNSFEESKTTNMEGMFFNCEELEYVYFNNFNTSNVTDMKGMFADCPKLKEIKGINTFNTNETTHMEAMFRDCESLECLDLSNFNTSKITDMTMMFFNCSKLKHLDLSNFNTYNVTNVLGMFAGCKSLEYLDISNFNTSNINNFYTMFCQCSKLKEIKGLQNFNTIKATNMSGMFGGCEALEYLDISNFNISNVTDMKSMFSKCKSLKHIEGINKFDNIKIQILLSIFQECNNLDYLINKGLIKEEDIAINFIIFDKNTNFPLACKSSDILSSLEEKIYLEFPELKEKNIEFFLNENLLNKSLTLKENKIMNGDSVVVKNN